jgi:uncharacterized membrane protein YjgN (DUF898 family)
MIFSYLCSQVYIFRVFFTILLYFFVAEPTHIKMIKPLLFEFRGTAGQYFVKGLLASLLMLCTFFIGTPWAIAMIQRWKAEHTYVNGRQLKFYGTGGDLFGKWILWGLLSIITAGIYLYWAVPSYYKWQTEHTHYAEFDTLPG